MHRYKLLFSSLESATPSFRNVQQHTTAFMPGSPLVSRSSVTSDARFSAALGGAMPVPVSYMSTSSDNEDTVPQKPWYRCCC